jgi:hypothetical protein
VGDGSRHAPYTQAILHTLPFIEGILQLDRVLKIGEMLVVLFELPILRDPTGSTLRDQLRVLQRNTGCCERALLLLTETRGSYIDLALHHLTFYLRRRKL